MYIAGTHRIFKVISLFSKLNNFDSSREKNLHESLFFIWICILSKMAKLKKMIKILLKFLIIFKKCFVLIWLKEMSPEYSKYFL